MIRMRAVVTFLAVVLSSIGQALLRIARRISGPGAGPKLVVG
jgi:hypothetical protein